MPGKKQMKKVGVNKKKRPKAMRGGRMVGKPMKKVGVNKKKRPKK